MKKIIIDTNFLLIPITQGVDIFSEFDRIMDEPFQLFVVDKTIEELNTIIQDQSGKDKQAAAFALQIIEQRPLNIIKTGKGHADGEILALKEYIVATQDKELKEKLRQQGRKVIFLRQKSHLNIQ
ncbi:nucleotide-binding protein [Candidatus Woesearchaeota archaeon]|nr:nucleotide-binding protein [Candidatus Woesearchaeota archaeon]